jgi:hypothetical protein
MPLLHTRRGLSQNRRCQAGAFPAACHQMIGCRRDSVLYRQECCCSCARSKVLNGNEQHPTPVGDERPSTLTTYHVALQQRYLGIPPRGQKAEMLMSIVMRANQSLVGSADLLSSCQNALMRLSIARQDPMKTTRRIESIRKLR